jgi:hypothetical protein
MPPRLPQCRSQSTVGLARVRSARGPCHGLAVSVWQERKRRGRGWTQSAGLDTVGRAGPGSARAILPSDRHRRPSQTPGPPGKARFCRAVPTQAACGPGSGKGPTTRVRERGAGRAGVRCCARGSRPPWSWPAPRRASPTVAPAPRPREINVSAPPTHFTCCDDDNPHQSSMRMMMSAGRPVRESQGWREWGGPESGLSKQTPPPPPSSPGFRRRGAT